MRLSSSGWIICTFFLVSLVAGCTPPKELHVTDFTNALKAKGVSVENIHGRSGLLISARDGAGMSIDHRGIEIYEYDTGIKSGRDALEKYATEGFMGQRMLRNKNLLLLQNEQCAHWAEIKQVFESL